MNTGSPYNEPGPGGSGFCATDSDPEDCCTRKHSFDSCDAITNCGCVSGTTCRVVGRLDTLADTQCGAIGERPVGALCDNDSQCVVGTQCARNTGLCSRLCRRGDNENKCDGDDYCGQFRFTGVSVEDVGYCWIRCTTETALEDCAEGAVCAHLFTGRFCFVQGPTCPPDRVDDGVCDETETNICAPGTDSDADCGR